MLNHIRESRFLRDTSQRRTKPEEWFVKENSHEALVSAETFRQAGEMLRQPRKSERNNAHPDETVFYCAGCGRKLRRTFGTDTYFSCATSNYMNSPSCEGVKWSKSTLESVLVPAYRAQLSLADKTIAEMRNEKQRKTPDDSGRRLEQIRKELDRCGKEKLSLLEVYHDARLSVEVGVCRFVLVSLVHVRDVTP